jgi:hypothetical protein
MADDQVAEVGPCPVLQRFHCPPLVLEGLKNSPLLLRLQQSSEEFVTLL